MNSARLLGYLPLALAATVALAAAPLHAQTADDRAAAESLFDRARALAKAGKHADACPLYAESLKLDPAVGTMLHLADCHEQVGRTASAWVGFREAAAAAKAAGQADRVRMAEQRAQALEPRLSRLNISVAPDARLPGLVVKRDGAVVSPTLLSTGVPVDPGPREITAEAPGRVPWKLRMIVGASGESSVVVPLLDVEPVAGAAVPPPAASATAPLPPTTSAAPVTPAASPQDTTSSTGRRTAGFALAGAGLVFTGASVLVGLSAKSKYGTTEGHCDASNRCDESGLDIQRSARARANVGTALFGVGLLAGGAAAYLLLTPSKSSPQVGVAPIVTPQVAGVAVGGAL